MSIAPYDLVTGRRNTLRANAPVAEFLTTRIVRDHRFRAQRPSEGAPAWYEIPVTSLSGYSFTWPPERLAARAGRHRVVGAAGGMPVELERPPVG